MIHTKKLAMSIPLTLVAFLLSTKLYAYSFTQDFNNGFYWRSFPIQMNKYVALQSDAANLERLTEEAVREWESVIGKDIWELSPVQLSSNFSGNFIRWSDNFGAETGYDPSRTLAITIRYNQGTFFERTVIILNGSISYLRQNFGNSLKITILHEIGHTIGLDHSDESNAVMAPSLGSVQSLQADDVSGGNAVVDENLRRQSIGYVSPLAARETEKGIAACGSVDFDKGDGPSNGHLSFLLTLIMGFLVVKLSSLVKFIRPRKSILLNY